MRIKNRFTNTKVEHRGVTYERLNFYGDIKWYKVEEVGLRGDYIQNTPVTPKLFKLLESLFKSLVQSK